MAVTAAEAMRFEDTATEDEFAAYLAAYDAAQEPTAHAMQFRDLFLVLSRSYPRRIPVVATIGVNPDGSRVLDGVWAFLPGRRAVWTSRGEVFDRTAEAVREQHAAHPIAA